MCPPLVPIFSCENEKFACVDLGKEVVYSMCYLRGYR
jgi:hypothetical protein